MAADALVYAVVDQLVSFIRERVEREVGLVRGVEHETQEQFRSHTRSFEKRQVEDRSLRDWLRKLKDAAYDLIDRWNTLFHLHQRDPFLVPQKKKGYSFISFPCVSVGQLTLRRDIALQINDLNEKLDDIATQKEKYHFVSGQSNATTNINRQTVAHVDLPMIKGRATDQEIVLTRLFCGSSEKGYNLSVVAIVGIGGIGKTTLAQLCSTDKAVKRHFRKIIWVCCEPFDTIEIATSIVEGFTGKAPEANTLNVLLDCIHKLASRERFLLVLDDVWPKGVKNWEPFKAAFLSCAKGSKVLVTTRSIEVAQQMHAAYQHFINKLSAEESWALFSCISLLDKKQNDSSWLIKIGREIVQKCDGLPLAVKSIGSLLRHKHRVEDWRYILDNGAWESKVVKGILCPPLLLSYHDLPYEVKQCFLYCAIFQKDETIDRNRLIQLWMAQGYLGTKEDMETKGSDYFEELASRSFFQNFIMDDKKSIVKCKIHDMVHDFVRFLAKDEFFSAKMSGEVEYLVSESSSLKPRHLTLKIPRGTTDLTSLATIKSGESLRTLFINSGTDVLWDWCDKFTHVRAMRLNGFSVRFPLKQERLILLRYLEISGDHRLKELSDSVCDLYNLQTLKIHSCRKFEKLPTGRKMGKLIKLRHLEIQTPLLKVCPKGVEMLRSHLQALDLFIVGNTGEEEERDTDEDVEYCNIGALGKWKQLHGHLGIRGLGNLRERSQAERAELKNKIHLSSLLLDFHIPNWQHCKRVMDDGEILEALHPPPPHLVTMDIRNYMNTEPSFLNNFLMSCFLPNLKGLVLWGLRKSKCLPHALSRLPCLETLHIAEDTSLEKVGDEFLGLSPSSSVSSSSSSLPTSVDFSIAFPKLERLEFSGMSNWEEWESSTACHSCKNEDRDQQVSVATTISIMPSLSHIRLTQCSKLKALPPFLGNAPLKVLRLDRCPKLEKNLTKEWPIWLFKSGMPVIIIKKE